MSVPIPATVEPSAVPDVARSGWGQPQHVAPAAGGGPWPAFLGVLSSLAVVWRRLPTKAKVGAAVIGFFVLIAIIGPTLAPFDPSYQNPSFQLSMHPPTSTYLLGTTEFGQDVLSELLTAVRVTGIVGVCVGLAATLLAAIIGVSAAYLGGVWDEILSLFTNVILVLPGLPLLIVILGYFPQSGQLPTIIVLSLLGWPWGARVIRAQTLALRNRDFVYASQETGERAWRVIIFDIIPNEISLLAANFVNTVLYAIGTSVALAFIGVTDLNSWSMGTILYWSEQQSALDRGAWWWFMPPGILVALMGMGLVLLNFGIDEIGNPRLRNASASRRLGLGTWSPSKPTLVVRAGPSGPVTNGNSPVPPIGGAPAAPVPAATGAGFLSVGNADAPDATAGEGTLMAAGETPGTSGSEP